jgi:hypothetical protein
MRAEEYYGVKREGGRQDVTPADRLHWAQGVLSIYRRNIFPAMENVFPRQPEPKSAAP